MFYCNKSVFIPSYLVMTEKEILENLAKFKEIKPNKEWVDFVFSKITLETPKKEFIPSKVKTVSFPFLKPQYKIAFAVFSLIFAFSFSIVSAQNSLPGSFLYPIKTLTQDIKIALAPKTEKPVLRMEILKSRLDDLSKVKKNPEEISKLASKIKSEMNLIPEEIEKLEKKKVVLEVSQRVKNKNEEIKNLLEKTNLEEKVKSDLSNSLVSNQNKVFALIDETEKVINNCPVYLEEKIANLKSYFENSQNLLTWTPEEVIKTKSLVLDVEKFIKAGNCLEAIEKLESIEKIMKIHSLEDTTTSTTK